MAFTMAADSYLEEKVPHLGHRSIQTEKERQKPLKAYFGAVSLIAFPRKQCVDTFLSAEMRDCQTER